MERYRRLPLTALCATLAYGLSAQALMTDEQARQAMKRTIVYLASDRLEGRETATEGEHLAADFIRAQFDSLGLKPMGDSASYAQAFMFAAPPTRGPKNTLQIGRSTLRPATDFYPVSWSASGVAFTKVTRCAYGIVAPEKGRNDFDGVDVKDHAAAFCISSPDGTSPHSKWIDHQDIGVRINDAVKLGAKAVLLYNDDPNANDLDTTLSKKVTASTVPVVFLTKSGFAELGLDGNPVVVQVDIERKQLTGHNMVAFLDNGKSNTIVIGAHYDHLGHGIEGSLWRGAPAIHNGADDNASGTAMMLQLAHDLPHMPDAKDNNYLFMAFSGEELGLYGSNWWTKHPTYPLDRITYMINMDMVGRLDTTNALAINGTGTSPTWARLKPVTDSTADRHTRKRPSHHTNDPAPFRIKTTDSGVGPSDQTSFYLQGIPAIHFFTGAHEDYHKPTDDEEKINYDGMVRVLRFIENLIDSLDKEPKLTFTKTAADSTEVPRFKVTMGVVPDYMYDGKGMRIDGVTDGKPAAAAGLLTGDIVIRLGSYDVGDMMSYMKALGAFKHGDTTKVTVLRAGKEVKADITFK